MSDTVPANVDAAFDMLLEEMTREVAVVKAASHSAIDANDFDEATRLTAAAKALDAFKGKVDALRTEWNSAAVAALPTKGSERVPSASPRRRHGQRLPPGIRTPEQAYYRPILRALVDVGGSAEMPRVLAMVERFLNRVLKNVDYEPILSNPKMTRWCNGCQWAKGKLVKRGLMRHDVPRGIWEITDAGRDCLAKNQSAVINPQ